MTMTASRLEIRPLSSALGAEIFGVDLAASHDDETVRALRRALLEHIVIFFRDQELAPHQLLALAQRFGEVVEYPLIKGLPECPLVLPVIKEPHERANFGGVWHSDTAYLERPAMASLLYALETPPAGGDTMFANMYQAYETPLRGHAAAARRAQGGQRRRQAGGAADPSRRCTKSAPRPPTSRRSAPSHPVVRTHPETGRRSLYVNLAHTLRFEGMTEAESAPLLSYLFAWQIQPEFTCRFRWQPGSLAFWDNRASQHYPLNDYHGHRRLMHRVTLEGDRPR